MLLPLSLSLSRKLTSSLFLPTQSFITTKPYSDGVQLSMSTTQFTQHKGHWETCDYLWWPDRSTVVITTHCSTLPPGQREGNVEAHFPPGKIILQFRKTPLGRKKPSAKMEYTNKLTLESILQKAINHTRKSIIRDHSHPCHKYATSRSIVSKVYRQKSTLPRKC